MKFIQDPRSEKEIFAELEALATEPGYAHAIAYLCYRDIAIGFNKNLKADDLAKLYSDDRLIRTEISTLIGLLVKGNLNLNVPSPDVLQQMLDKTDQLLLELHSALLEPSLIEWSQAIKEESAINPFTRGEAFREAIFYCGESAYDFQYREFAVLKYLTDNEWLKINKGFSIDEAVRVIRSITRSRKESHNSIFDNLRKKELWNWTLLPAYTFSMQRVVESSKLNPEIVSKILDSFSLSAYDHNEMFNSVSDFNATNACPLIRISETEFVLFQEYSLVQALYESPFYWMIKDTAYSDIASKSRGAFTERFCADRMRSVFGERRVYENVLLIRGKGMTVGEIDVLVLFGDRAIILQAKSKGLTIESRKGNDNQLKDDFKLAIQDSYSQGLSCAKLIQDKAVTLIDKSSTEIKLGQKLNEIYILCVLSEHYPALAFQAHQLIKIEKNGKILPPFVMDIFLLDTMAEMLASPLFLLSYINRRTSFDYKVLANHELTILSYHLKNNLWKESDTDFLMLHDDICADLDVAMMTRRDGLPGKATPEGILTRRSTTMVGKIIAQIENSDNPDLIDLGFLLLELSEDTVTDFSRGIRRIMTLAAKDFSNHDMTIGIDAGKTGITVHSNFNTIDEAIPALLDHCERRKYIHKAQSWFGLILEPGTASIRFFTKTNIPWEQSSEMDAKVAHMSIVQKEFNHSRSTKSRKRHGRKR